MLPHNISNKQSISIVTMAVTTAYLNLGSIITAVSNTVANVCMDFESHKEIEIYETLSKLSVLAFPSFLIHTKKSKLISYIDTLNLKDNSSLVPISTLMKKLNVTPEFRKELYTQLDQINYRTAPLNKNKINSITQAMDFEMEDEPLKSQHRRTNPSPPRRHHHFSQDNANTQRRHKNNLKPDLITGETRHQRQRHNELRNNNPNMIPLGSRGKSDTAPQLMGRISYQSHPTRHFNNRGRQAA